MLAAAAEAPTGSHHVFATKKEVLTKVISQMIMRRMRPMQHDPQVGFSAFPTEARFECCAIGEVGYANRGEYITAFSERKRVLASILFLLTRLLFGKSS